jgi:hypothetical protein
MGDTLKTKLIWMLIRTELRASKNKLEGLPVADSFELRSRKVINQYVFSNEIFWRHIK